MSKLPDLHGKLCLELWLIFYLFFSSGKTPGADLGPLISPSAKDRVINLVTSGEKDGCDVLLDGRDLTVPGYEKGNFVGPTVLHGVKVKFSLTSNSNLKNMSKNALRRLIAMQDHSIITS